MKTLSNGGEILRSSLLVKISVAVFVAFASFYIGTRWSDGYQQLALFSSKQYFAITSKTHWVAISPNMDKDFDLSSLIGDNQTQAVLDSTSLSNPPPSPPPLRNSTSKFPPPQPPPPPPPASIQRFGVVDENGTMSVDFEVGEFDPEYVENWGNASATQVDAGNSKPSIRVMKYPMCPETRREYIPCLDNLEAIRQLKSTERGEKFERHCPEEGRGLNCLVPQPKGYKVPFGWPRSRDQVWPHTRLVKDKRGQNRISKENGMFKFPGGGTQFIHGADQYIDQIEKMVPGIAFGRRTRVALDVGCGVASFGAYLLSRNVITMSIAPKDFHRNQIQFALEWGVPAMAAAFATRRLLYPSQGFELIHCSRCRINWIRDDGILLLEANRMLRGGGYFVWAAQPVYKHEDSLEEQWKEMVNLTARMCWELVKKDSYIAIWQKPLNNSCYLSRELGIHPPLCNRDDDPDKVWYVDLKACITWLPENGYGTNVRPWPERLENPPHRLRSIEMDAYISREELFKAESKYWRDIINGYVHVFRWKKLRLRNVMDMSAGFGGFAAALLVQPIDCWVMNVVPISGPNTLPVLYDRGLVGVMHDWCEPFDTYPRTYDFLHAAGLFTVEQRRCDISRIMVEMDRILRPGGHVYIRDSISVVYELQRIAEAMGWHAGVRETAEGRHASYRILTCYKPLRRS